MKTKEIIIWGVGGIILLSALSSKPVQKAVSGEGGSLFGGVLRESAGGTTTAVTTETEEFVGAEDDGAVFVESSSPAIASSSSRNKAEEVLGESISTGNFDGVVFRDSSGKIVGVEDESIQQSRLATPTERLINQPLAQNPLSIFKPKPKTSSGSSNAFLRLIGRG